MLDNLLFVTDFLKMRNSWGSIQTSSAQGQ